MSQNWLSATESADPSGARSERVVDEQNEERKEEQKKEQRRLSQHGQEQSKQGKELRFGEEQQLRKMEAENASEPEVMGRTTEVRTGRGHAGLVPATGKASEKATEERESMKAKEEDLATKGNTHEGERGGPGPNGA